eukprot:2956265-Rhodomonas_salina.1
MDDDEFESLYKPGEGPDMGAFRVCVWCELGLSDISVRFPRGEGSVGCDVPAQLRDGFGVWGLAFRVNAVRVACYCRRGPEEMALGLEGEEGAGVMEDEGLGKILKVAAYRSVLQICADARYCHSVWCYQICGTDMAAGMTLRACYARSG